MYISEVQNLAAMLHGLRFTFYQEKLGEILT